MKTLGLVLAMVVVLGGSAVADTVNVQFDVYANWNCISSPIVPIDSDPLTVFAGANDGIDGLVSRWDPTSGGVFYDSLDPSGFGGVLLGDGYWLLQSQGGTISINGVPDGVPDAGGNKTDMWISLPGNQADGQDKGGWHLIGQPFNHNTAVDDGTATGANIKFTDGTTVKTWDEAAQAGWVASNMIGWDSVTGGVNIQYDGLGDDDTLRPGHGYQILTGKDNLAMIIPAN